ncbi:MAG TPA: hypothetical protein PK788_07905, partial [Gemmatimonadaceae bacterium]|nr:hypothetical protein [Gemmatimonadaceae bacterium]
MMPRVTVLLQSLGALALLTLAQPAQAQGTETVVPAAGMGGIGSGPNGATLRCKDGSYPTAGAPDSACDGKGGVLVRFPARQRPQPTASATAPRRPAVASSAARDTTPPEGFVPWRDRRAAAAEQEAQRR